MKKPYDEMDLSIQCSIPALKKKKALEIRKHYNSLKQVIHSKCKWNYYVDNMICKYHFITLSLSKTK